MTTRKALAMLAVAALAACGEDAKKIATGSVSGTATYQGRSDHSGISVTVAGFSTITNAGGAYSFAEVPVGSQVVIAMAPESVERTQTTSVDVSGATTAAALTFTPVVPLRGVASAVAGGTVTVQLDPPSGPSTSADGSGRFSFANVSAGTHSLRFSSTTLSSVDTIPQVLYLPALGTFVVDTQKQNQLHQFAPFKLPAGRRLMQATFFSQIFFGSFYPSAPPGISADGAIAIGSEINSTTCCSTDNLYVANAVTGERVLVTNRLQRFASSLPRIAPDSRTIVYQTTEANAPLFAVVVSSLAPLTLSTPVKLGEQTGRWEFSPQTASTVPVVLAVGIPPPPASTVNLYAVRTDNAQTAGGPFADPVGDFQLSVQKKRMIFARNTAGAQNLYTVDCSGATLGTPAVVEAFGGAYSWSPLGFSKDEGLFAYRVITHPTPANQGMRVVANNGSAVGANWIGAASVPAAADAVNLVFAPDNSRVLFNSGNTLYRRPADGSAAGASLGTGPGAYTFSADGTRILYDIANLANRELRLANADGSGTPAVIEGPSAYFSASVAADASMAIWLKSDGAGGTQLWVRRGLLTGTPPAAKLVDTAASLNGFIPSRGLGPVYTKQNATFSQDMYALTAADAPVLVGNNWNGDQQVNTDGTRMLLSFFTSNFFGSRSQVAKLVNLTTGGSTTLLETFGGPAQFVPGTTERLLLYQMGSQDPYTYQDGAYITDVP